MQLGSAERGVCESCNCEHYYQTDTCEITMEMARCDDVLSKMVPSDVRILISRAEKAEALVKAIESAWQDAELRAERAEARVRELEAES